MAWKLNGLGDLSVEKMEVVHLRERGGVVDTGQRSLLLKVAVALDSILGGAKVRIDGVGATSGSRVLKLDVLTRSGNLGISNLMEILLHLRKLNVEELLNGWKSENSSTN